MEHLLLQFGNIIFNPGNNTVTQTLTFDEKNWPANWTYSNMDKEEVDMKNHKYVLTPSFVNGTSENGTLRYAFNVEVRFYVVFKNSVETS